MTSEMFLILVCFNEQERRNIVKNFDVYCISPAFILILIEKCLFYQHQQVGADSPEGGDVLFGRTDGWMGGWMGG